MYLGHHNLIEFYKDHIHNLIFSKSIFLSLNYASILFYSHQLIKIYLKVMLSKMATDRFLFYDIVY